MMVSTTQHYGDSGKNLFEALMNLEYVKIINQTSALFRPNLLHNILCTTSPTELNK